MREKSRGYVRRAGNRVLVRGQLRAAHLHYFCMHVYSIVKKHESANVILDYSECSLALPATMLPLIAIIDKYRRMGIGFNLIEPEDEKLRQYFVNYNWAHYIDPERYSRTLYEGGDVPAFRFLDDPVDDKAEYSGDIIDGVMNLILVELETDRETLSAVEWALGEIMDNVSSHSRSGVGRFVQAVAYKQKNEVEFVVADSGIGIPTSMSVSPDERALQMAINEDVTSNPHNGAGNGLYGSYQVADRSGGQFAIHSYYGILYGLDDGELVITSSKAPYPGTSVRCRIGVGNRDLLHEALNFKNQPHKPAFDFVERQFENEEGQLVFDMKKNARRHFGSRHGGRRVRAIIENLLRSGGPIVLDFDGVGVFSSSFADEVLGRLFVNMGEQEFRKHIIVRNAIPTVAGLIRRAIVQRTKLHNRNP